MSNRANAYKYGGVRATPDDGWWVLGDLLANKKVTGGPSIDPTTGEISFSPYQGPRGLLGARGRRRAEELNAEILGPAYLEQLRRKTGLEVEKERGTQDRTTNSEKIAKEIEALKEKGYNELLREEGLPDTPENRQYWESKINPNRQESARKRNEYENRSLDQPDIQSYYDQNKQGQLQKPFVENAERLKTITPRDSISTIPVVPGMNAAPSALPGGTINTFGATTKQEPNYITGPNGEQIPYGVRESTIPGRIENKFRINPELKYDLSPPPAESQTENGQIPDSFNPLTNPPVFNPPGIRTTPPTTPSAPQESVIPGFIPGSATDKFMRWLRDIYTNPALHKYPVQ